MHAPVRSSLRQAPRGVDVAVPPRVWLSFSEVDGVRAEAPRNQVGWLLLTLGLLVGINAVTSALIAWDYSRPGALWGAGFNADVNQLVQRASLGVLIRHVLLLFASDATRSPGGAS